MKKYLTFLAVIVSLNSFSQNSCFKKIPRSEWNLTICIDNTMRVSNGDDEILINKFNNPNSPISILINFNEDKLSAKKLWKKKFKKNNSKILNSKFQSDSTYEIKGNSYYKSIYKGKLNQQNVYFVSSVVIYNNQYYTFQYNCRDLKESKIFFDFVLHNVEFSGAPTLKNNKKTLEKFYSSLTQAITDTSKMSSILISYEKIISVTPEEENEKMSEEEIKSVKNMISQWNQSAYDFANNFKPNQKISIISKDLKLDNSQPWCTGYTGSITFRNKKKETFKAKIFILEINGKIFLGKVILDNN